MLVRLAFLHAFRLPLYLQGWPLITPGFLPAILQILHALPPKSGPKGQWQGMCFSATVPPKMEQVFAHILSKDHIAVSTIDKSEPPTLAKVPQFSVLIPKVEQTFTALYSVLQQEIKATEGGPKIIVFGTTAKLVALYAKIYDGVLDLPVFELHSRLSQPARTRATAAFKETKTGIMFASDGMLSVSPFSNCHGTESVVIGRGMDFPDVSLVLQVGLPTDADAYTHRVGRTARAGKDGKAILLLTEAESFYLKANRQFPIQPYPHSDTVVNGASAAIVHDVLQNIDPDVKQKAYSAYLGFMKVATNKMRMTPEQLVAMANVFALKGMGCDEVPPMEKSTIACVYPLPYILPYVRLMNELQENGSERGARYKVRKKGSSIDDSREAGWLRPGSSGAAPSPRWAQRDESEGEAIPQLEFHVGSTAPARPERPAWG